MIALLDYGAGNLTSVRKGLAAAGADVYTPATPADLSRASAVVVPGVGHFSATASLDARWRTAIEAVVRTEVPLLGICLGLQWLFEGSDEAPELSGLGLLEGRSVRLPSGAGRKVPHVGWNALNVTRASALLEGVPPAAYAYFTHSYAAPVTTACTATTDHGVRFASAVERGRIFGVQFHPEKSGPAGVRMLQNFVLLSRRR